MSGWENLERAKGFEPSTPTLARLCSTPELHPLARLSPQAGPIWRKACLIATGKMPNIQAGYRTSSAGPLLSGSPVLRKRAGVLEATIAT